MDRRPSTESLWDKAKAAHAADPHVSIGSRYLALLRQHGYYDYPAYSTPPSEEPPKNPEWTSSPIPVPRGKLRNTSRRGRRRRR